jgi:hypothetical protein
MYLMKISCKYSESPVAKKKLCISELPLTYLGTGIQNIFTAVDQCARSNDLLPLAESDETSAPEIYHPADIQDCSTPLKSNTGEIRRGYLYNGHAQKMS